MSKRVTLGTVEVSAVIFRCALSKDSFYVVGREEMDHIEFDKKYNTGKDRYSKATGVELDDAIYDKFFMVFVSDCFDPPIAIVRSDNEQDAVDEFVTHIRWADIPQEDVEKATEAEQEAFGYGPKGQVYDSENMQVRSCKLVRVEVD